MKNIQKMFGSSELGSSIMVFILIMIGFLLYKKVKDKKSLFILIFILFIASISLSELIPLCMNCSAAAAGIKALTFLISILSQWIGIGFLLAHVLSYLRKNINSKKAS